MGPNTTGVAQPQDYMLGRGRLYLALLSATTLLVTGGWRDVGNVPEMKISATSNTLDHFSSRSGVKELDRQVVISEEFNLTFQVDELNHENLASFFSATQTTATNAAVAGFGARLMVAHGDLALGRWYDIIDGSGNRAYNVNAADVTVVSDEVSPITYTLNTDYTVDTVMGRIFILSTSTKAATTIAAVKGLTVTLAAKAGAGVVSEVRVSEADNVIVALKFISINENNNGLQTEYEFHKVSLKPDGDYNLIGDTFTQMGFTAKAESNALKSPNSPTLTIRFPNTQS